MAWMERHGPRHRVRYRYAGRTVLDGTYDTADAAHARITQLDHLNRAARQRLAAPPPTEHYLVFDAAGMAAAGRVHGDSAGEDHREDPG